MARIATSVSYSFTMRLRIVNNLGMFAKVLHVIARQQGDPGAVDVVRADRNFKVRDLTVSARDDEHARAIIDSINASRASRLSMSPTGCS